MSRPAPGSVFLQQSLSRALVDTTPGMRTEKKEGRAMEGAGSLQQHFVVPDMVPAFLLLQSQENNWFCSFMF